MALLLDLLLALAALVSILSGLACYFVNAKYLSILEKKFPDMIQSLSTRRKWATDPITYLWRWRKAIKLGDEELTKVAKICCLLLYICAATGICVFLWGMMSE
jgi:hypothetical protein